MGFSSGGRLLAEVGTRPILTDSIILYMCKVFNHKTLGIIPINLSA